MAAPFNNTLDFTYDPFGRRESKSVVGGATTNYLNAGIDVIAEYDGSNNLLRRYVMGPGIDNAIAHVNANGARTYYHQNRLGSVVATSDDAGNQVDTYT